MKLSIHLLVRVLGTALILVVVAALSGCGAPLADVTATATSAATYTTETLVTYAQANTADATVAAANATTLLTNCQTAIADARAMPSTAQIQADAAAAIQIIGEIIQMIPEILPVFGDKNARKYSGPADQAAILAKLYDLRTRLQVIRAHYAKQ